MAYRDFVSRAGHRGVNNLRRGARAGIAELPLHGGRCPKWLFTRMTNLARALLDVMVSEAGPETVLTRVADPFWFQALGCVLGFDWHSSGLTTTVCGALKEAVRASAGAWELFVCGGKGAVSRRTPEEIMAVGERFPLDVNPETLVATSKLVAKVDTAAVQDGYQLYHHVFIFTARGDWAVIQQGMNEENGYARRYHWLSMAVDDPVCEPHLGICCDARGETLNLVAAESEANRSALTALAREEPRAVVRELRLLREKVLRLPPRHQLFLRDLNPDGLERVLLKGYLCQPADFRELLGTPGVGARTIRALSLLAEIVYGAPPSFRDPARYAFAHGGKDGYPFPVDRRVYDHSIAFLENALRQARVGRTEKMAAFRRLAVLQHT